MIYKSWVRKVFGFKEQDARASRRGKCRQPSRYRFAPTVQLLEDRRAPATLMVTNTSDSGAGSLRQAILDSAGQNRRGDQQVFGIFLADLCKVFRLDCVFCTRGR